MSGTASSEQTREADEVYAPGPAPGHNAHRVVRAAPRRNRSESSAQRPAGLCHARRRWRHDFHRYRQSDREVRYIGINSPEIHHPTKGREPYRDAAREANARLVDGRWVQLVLDVQARDSFGRLLAYVYVGSRFVNAELVWQGYAEAATYPRTSGKPSTLVASRARRVKGGRAVGRTRKGCATR